MSPLLLIACASGDGPDPASLAALQAFVDAPTQSPHFYGPDPESTVEDIEALASAVDGHHDLVRAWVHYQGELHWLFAQVAGEELVWVAIVPPAPDGEVESEPARAYMESWNVPSAERLELLEPVWGEQARYVDPNAEGFGPEGLSQVIDDFDDQFPRTDLLPSSAVVTQGEFIHFRWVMDATLFNLEGMDVGIVGPDGRLELIAGFFGELEPD